VKATAKGGAVANGELHLDQLRLATIGVFEELLLDDTIHKRRHMEVLGQTIYEGLFDTEIDQLLNDELRSLKGKSRLRLQLSFEKDADPDIISLPWEFLYSPARQDFLATDVNLVLSRYMELGQNREEFSASERPLRILVAISRPQDERAVLATDVVNAIRSLNKEDQDPIVSVEVVDPPTLNSIEAALNQFQPHIFHFIGHGKYDPAQRTGYLLLVNPDDNNSDRCDDSTLIDCFKRAQCFPRLVFLHMCEGGITERDATTLQAFSGFAPKLIHAKIPSVVAMQYPIKNVDAREFSIAFYTTLADGGSVDEAVQEGRSRLDLYRRSRVFGTPVLYMHSAGGLVLPKPPPDTVKITSSSGAGAGAEKPKPQPAADAAAAPAPMDQADLDNIFKIGLNAAQSITDNNAKIAMTQRLLKLKKGLAGKTRTDVFNAIYQDWAKDTDPNYRDVLVSIMEAI
jgi:hypothetical protein